MSKNWVPVARMKAIKSFGGRTIRRVPLATRALIANAEMDALTGGMKVNGHVVGCLVTHSPKKRKPQRQASPPLPYRSRLPIRPGIKPPWEE